MMTIGLVMVWLLATAAATLVISAVMRSAYSEMMVEKDRVIQQQRWLLEKAHERISELSQKVKYARAEGIDV